MGQGYPGRPNPPLTRTRLGQLCAALRVSQSRPAATQSGIEPGSVVMSLALRSSALDRCASREAPDNVFLVAKRFLLEDVLLVFYNGIPEFTPVKQGGNEGEWGPLVAVVNIVKVNIVNLPVLTCSGDL